MPPTVITALGGISGVFGVISLAVYCFFYFSFKISESKAKRSIRNLIEGERRFTAESVLKILERFTDNHSRLEALQILTKYDIKDVRQLLESFRSEPALRQFEKRATGPPRRFCYGSSGPLHHCVLAKAEWG